MIRRMVAIKLVLASLTALAVSSGAAMRDARAQVPCPLTDGSCIFVSSNADTNDRDSVVTLREALMLSSGDLKPDELTEKERAGVVDPPGAEGRMGETSIYFDPALFCLTCPTNTIVLTPPGFGGDGGILRSYKGSKMVVLPPIRKGAELDTPPGMGDQGIFRVRIGMGYDPVAGEVPARVIIDGSKLSDTHAGLWFEGGGWIRGVTFQNFAGHAVEINEDVLDSVSLGGMGIYADGGSPATVRFKNNSADVYIVKP